MRRSLLIGAVTAAAALTVTSAVAITSPAAAAPSAGTVLDETYGGGGNSGATLKNDFIELANRSAAARRVDGWSVQYLPASPSSATTWQVTSLTGTEVPGTGVLTDSRLVCRGSGKDRRGAGPAVRSRRR